MSIFDEFRQPSEPLPAPPLADEPLPPEFEREPATFEPCPTCRWVVIEDGREREVRNIIFWEDPYGNTHCANCLWPPHLVMVRRVLALVATYNPSHYLAPIEQGDVYDQVERTDFLKAWKGNEQRRERLKREQAREKAMEGKSDGY